jgi:hypothetical protein
VRPAQHNRLAVNREALGLNAFRSNSDSQLVAQPLTGASIKSIMRSLTNEVCIEI